MKMLGLGGMKVTQVLVLWTLPVAVLERVTAATPLTLVILVSPLGLIGFSEKPTRKSKAVQRLIIWAQPPQGIASGSKVNTAKSIKLSPVRNFTGNNLSPSPLEPHFDFSWVRGVEAEGTKPIRHKPTPIHRKPNMLQPIQSNGSQR
jgi:hypothetical protein